MIILLRSILYSGHARLRSVYSIQCNATLKNISIQFKQESEMSHSNKD